jgi:NADH:ubiquinone oxidoreductase subunit 4 (subunit M)
VNLHFHHHCAVCAGGFLWTCGFVLVLCILFGSFIEDNVFWLIISGAGAILFAAYLLYDLQKLMGGRYLAIHPDDYIYAAVQARSTSHSTDTDALLPVFTSNGLSSHGNT